MSVVSVSQGLTQLSSGCSRLGSQCPFLRGPSSSIASLHPHSPPHRQLAVSCALGMVMFYFHYLEEYSHPSVFLMTASGTFSDTRIPDVYPRVLCLKIAWFACSLHMSSCVPQVGSGFLVYTTQCEWLVDRTELSCLQ